MEQLKTENQKAMEHNKTSFDEIWEREERQGLQRRLRNEYPAWRSRRRTGMAVAASVAILAVAGVSIFNLQPASHPYDGIACNRSGIADAHWADVAANILTIQTI